MFGTLKPKQLDCHSKSLYQSSFCGTCHAMAGLGRVWSLATGYDIAFLHLVLAALEEAPISKRPCTALPFHKIPVRAVSVGSQQWLSAFHILLMMEKCLDDIEDEGGWKGRMGSALMRKQYQRGLRTVTLSGFDPQHVVGLHSRQAQAEQQDITSLEALAQPTAVMLGEAFAHLATLTNKSARASSLRHLGQGLGAVIYIRDALQDYPEDKSLVRFNAIDHALGPNWSEAHINRIIERELARALYGLRTLGLEEEQNLAESILAELSTFHNGPNNRQDCSCRSQSSKQQKVTPIRTRAKSQGLCELLICCDLAACCDIGACACSGADCGFCCCPCDVCTVCASDGPGVGANSESTAAPKRLLPCPACHGSLRTLTIQGKKKGSFRNTNIQIDECEKCFGLWFDKGELETLTALEKIPPQLLNLSTRNPRELRPEGTRPCPRCGVTMVGSIIKQTKIDLCSSCQGLWLDRGELNAIL